MEEKISRGSAELTDIVMPGQTNHLGTLFGGELVAMMDKAAGIAATRYCKGDSVTVSIDNIVFENPVKLGETVVVSARLIYVGKTSMMLRVRAESENHRGERKLIISGAHFVFVSVDTSGKPMRVPIPLLESEEERKLFEEGKKIKEKMKR